MLDHLHLKRFGICVLAALGCLMFSIKPADSHPSHGSGSRNSSAPPATQIGGNQRPAKDLGLNASSLRPLHGGQVTATKWHFFEVVYKPKETRIYVYSPSQRPIGAAGMRGEVVMQIHGNSKKFRYAVKERTDESGMIYSAVDVDVSRVRDGDMQVIFDLSRLPFREERKTRFVQTFALFRPASAHPAMARPAMQVTVARLSEADRPLIQRQRNCPVMDAELTSHGQPIKLMVGNQPLFVCCKGCIAEVEKKPTFYLQKVSAPTQQNQQQPQPRVSVSYATRTDEAAIRSQQSCPVTNQRLGDHGTPIKVLIDGQPLFVCCKGCIDQVVQNPHQYFRNFAGNAETNRQLPQRRQISVSQATSADQVAIRAQGHCPVMNQALGGHGAPIKITIDGQPLFVCCKGCIRKVEQNPDLYLAKVKGY